MARNYLLVLGALLLVGGALVMHARLADPAPLAAVVQVTGLPGPARSVSYLEARFMLDPAEGVQVHPALAAPNRSEFTHGR